jgi:hypothetical protein
VDRQRLTPVVGAGADEHGGVRARHRDDGEQQTEHDRPHHDPIGLEAGALVSACRSPPRGHEPLVAASTDRDRAAARHPVRCLPVDDVRAQLT